MGHQSPGPTVGKAPQEGSILRSQQCPTMHWDACGSGPSASTLFGEASDHEGPCMIQVGQQGNVVTRRLKGSCLGFLVTQLVKSLPAMQETPVQFSGSGTSLGEGIGCPL